MGMGGCGTIENVRAVIVDTLKAPLMVLGGEDPNFAVELENLQKQITALQTERERFEHEMRAVQDRIRQQQLENIELQMRLYMASHRFCMEKASHEQFEKCMADWRVDRLDADLQTTLRRLKLLR